MTAGDPDTVLKFDIQSQLIGTRWCLILFVISACDSPTVPPSNQAQRADESVDVLSETLPQDANVRGGDLSDADMGSQNLDLTLIPPSDPSSKYEMKDFIGAEACGACHESQYREWRRSSHGRAGGTPSQDVIEAPFDGQPILLRDGSITPIRDADGYALLVKTQNRSIERHSIDGVVGAGLMLGGGAQSYFSQQEDGRLLLLPFEYNVPSKRWFCQTVGPLKWAPLSKEVSTDDCGWPPERALGSVPGTNCQNCHGSQIIVHFNEDQGQYETRVKDFRINCESCHGPGREHRARIESGLHLKDGDIAMDSPALDNTWASVDRCLSCHSNKMVIAPGYLPGMNFHEFFATQTIWTVQDRLTSFDGRLLRFGYQQAHLSSPCFKDGSMSCVDCHSPHSMAYRDVHGRGLKGRFDDGQCTGCHPSKDTPNHRGHSVESDVQCTSCHMAYHEPTNVGPHFNHRRSDHRISIPRPSIDRASGFESPCSACHAETTVEWQESAIQETYGQTRPQIELVAALTEASLAIQKPSSGGQKQAFALVRKAISNLDERSPPASLYALSYFLEFLLQDDQTNLDGQTIQGLWRLTRSQNLDLRAAALTALLFLADRPAVHAGRLIETLLDQGENLTAIKRKIIFNFVGIQHAMGSTLPEDVQRHILDRLVRVASPLDELRLELPTTIAMTYSMNQAYELAHAQLMVAKASPLFKGSTYPVGTFGARNEVLKLVTANHMAAGREEHGIRALENALDLYPYDHESRKRLCEQKAAKGPIRDVIACFDDWISYAPRFADGYFIRAQYLERIGRFREALDSIEDGLRIAPDFEPARTHRDVLRGRLK